MDKNKDNSKQYILDAAIPLFSKSGFSNVSIRDIAQAAGIKSGSLYYHFSNKQSIYLEAIKYSFSNKAIAFTEVLESDKSALEKLELFIFKFTEIMSEDENFRRLLQREMLDGDEQRLRYLAEKVFQQQFVAIAQLISQISSKCDPHMLTISIGSLIMHHFETAHFRQFLPGYQVEQDSTAYIANHVFKLLTTSIVDYE